MEKVLAELCGFLRRKAEGDSRHCFCWFVPKPRRKVRAKFEAEKNLGIIIFGEDKNGTLSLEKVKKLRNPPCNRISEIRMQISFFSLPQFLRILISHLFKITSMEAGKRKFNRILLKIKIKIPIPCSALYN